MSPPLDREARKLEGIAHDLGRLHGFGALMQATSRAWAAWAESAGLPPGGRLTIGPCVGALPPGIRNGGELLAAYRSTEADLEAEREAHRITQMELRHVREASVHNHQAAVAAEAERDALAERVRYLEAPGECASLHKLRAERDALAAS